MAKEESRAVEAAGEWHLEPSGIDSDLLQGVAGDETELMWSGRGFSGWVGWVWYDLVGLDLGYRLLVWVGLVGLVGLGWVGLGSLIVVGGFNGLYSIHKIRH